MSDTVPVDIGHGMTACLRLAEGPLSIWPEGVMGVVITHACPKAGGAVRDSFIPVKPYSPTRGWDLVSREPISLHPSVNWVGCCGLHGFVTGGKWVPA